MTMKDVIIHIGEAILALSVFAAHVAVCYLLFGKVATIIILCWQLFGAALMAYELILAPVMDD